MKRTQIQKPKVNTINPENNPRLKLERNKGIIGLRCLECDSFIGPYN